MKAHYMHIITAESLIYLGGEKGDVGGVTFAYFAR